MRQTILDARHSSRRRRLELIALGITMFCGAAEAGVAFLQARWSQPRITACFLGEDVTNRERVVELTRRWVHGTGLEVDFGPAPNQRTCAPGSRDHIRIAFKRGSGNFSALGRQAAEAPGQETMNLDLEGLPPELASQQALHEIGHALGLMHQEQSPRFGCREELVGRYASSRAYKELLRLIVPDDGKYIVSGYDVQSVMRAFTAPEHFAQGERSPCYAPPMATLSKDDRDLIARMYPPRPPDVSAATRHESISIVLDGAMSQENLQYLIPELRRRQLVGLRQYIDAEGLNPSEVLVREGLSPTAAVSKEFERHLCSENPHICVRRSGGSPVWSNQKAVANVPAEPGECGSETLAKSIICLPNARVQPQRVLVESRYEPSKATLADYVVQTTRGCDEWNDDCRAIVELSNPKLDPRFYRTRFRDEKAIILALPATVYRVPVEYRSVEERKSIVGAVDEVKQQRAKQLGVNASDIAIRLVEPTGNPIPQAYSGFLNEPVRSYAEALQAMNFPFKDEASEQELVKYADVHVALWDRRVDATHCEFERSAAPLLFVTPFTQPQQLDPEPPKSGECGKERQAEIKPIEWWDHGTHVAGILAAQVNGKGIAGVNPRMTLWSWELVDGNQFNAGDNPFFSAMAKHRINPTIVNISQTFPRSTTLQSTALQTLLFGAGQSRGEHNLRLFVAAAGVDRDELSRPVGRRVDEVYDCNLVPACWSHTQENQKPKNLISVVALDASGTRVLGDGQRFGSHHGAMFDVAAVGAVTSTMHGNWLGSWFGSSMAAPYVTGLASLIEGKARGLSRETSPAMIKERILVTADRHTPELQASSRYGRINFARALDFTSDVIVLKKATACIDCTLRGDVAKTKVRIQYTQFDGGPTVQREVPLADLRRIVADPSGALTVHFMDGIRLLTAQGAEFVDLTQLVHIAGKGVALANIEDWTVASFRN